jgi:CDP-glucose 4,6-dehydratase
MYLNKFQGKKVLVTGHTGFKGSWLVAWLLRLGASVSGVSDRVPTSPAHFDAAKMAGKISNHFGDVRDLERMVKVINEEKPDFLFHLAAQPLVRRSYHEPHVTIETNVMGTANVLEALRLSQHPCTAIVITSDKCYDNIEQVWGYRENDALGGKDPYSASKGAAEMVVKTYAHSYFSAADSPVKVAVGRAGNVIGGGDWADDRIVPDCVRAWSRKEAVEIRYPKATRPWQHVLEPLSGYLMLAVSLANDSSLNGEAYNFGPPAQQNFTVAELLDEIKTHWPGASWKDVSGTSPFHEAGLLKLCCDKALHQIGWQPVMDFAETVRLTSSWYRSFYESPNGDVWEQTQIQIAEYESLARNRGIKWVSA